MTHAKFLEFQQKGFSYRQRVDNFHKANHDTPELQHQ